MAYFADTWFWVCLLNKKEADYELAHKLQKKIGNQPIVTSQFVMFEFLNHCSSLGPHLRTACFKLVKQFNSAPNITVIPYSNILYDRAFELYEKMSSDKQWSLTDCASFYIMEDQKITIAVTGDHHFEQRGYQLLKP